MKGAIATSGDSSSGAWIISKLSEDIFEWPYGVDFIFFENALFEGELDEGIGVEQVCEVAGAVAFDGGGMEVAVFAEF